MPAIHNKSEHLAVPSNAVGKIVNGEGGIKPFPDQRYFI